MTTPPPGEPPRADDTKPSWAWEPQLSPESEPDPAAPPESAGGAEMRERLRERGLLAEQSEPAAAQPPEPQGELPPPADAPATADELPPFPPVPPPGATGAPPPPEAPALATAPPLWPPVPPPPPPRDRYPMLFDVAYPEGLSRWKTLVRLFLVIPPFIAVAILNYFVQSGLFFGWTAVFWRKKYPDWLFRGMSGAFGFEARTYAYALLLTDKFPSFSKEESPVTLEFDEPPSGYLSRWRVFFWKFILLIPHFFVLWFLLIAVSAVTVIAWFAILFTGNYPRGMFQFVVGVQRWWWRITGYFASFNDRFPPYAVSAEAGPASNGSTVANGIIGGVATAGIAALFITVAAIQGDVETIEADYAALQDGRAYTIRLRDVFEEEEEVTVRLTRAVDPGDDLIQVIRPAANERVIVFQWTIENDGTQDALITASAARLKIEYEDGRDTETRTIGAAVIGVNNVTAPANIRSGGSASVQAVFVVPEDAEPLELRFSGGFANAGIKYEFE